MNKRSFVILVLVVLIAFLWLNSTKRAEPPAPPQKPDQQPVAATAVANATAEGFKAGFNAAEEKRRQQEATAVANREPQIRHLAGGACEVTFFSPPPALIKTGCTFGPSEAFYVRTDREVQNLGIGIRSTSLGSDQNTKLVFPQESFTRKPLGIRNSQNDQRELVFDTGAATFSGDRCTIYVSKGAGVIAYDEYRPGIKASKVFQ